MPIDIKDVKAGIQAGRLFVQLKDDHIMLGDYQTGEAVRLSDIDVQPVVHAKWDKDSTCTACGRDAFYTEYTEPKYDYDWDENLVQCGEETHFQFIHSPYCPNCGARMDGDPHDERGQ